MTEVFRKIFAKKSEIWNEYDLEIPLKLACRCPDCGVVLAGREALAAHHSKVHKLRAVGKSTWPILAMSELLDRVLVYEMAIWAHPHQNGPCQACSEAAGHDFGVCPPLTAMCASKFETSCADSGIQNEMV